MAKMIGDCVPVGPGGRNCSCCGDAPRRRPSRKRSIKRAEKQAFRRELARGDFR